MGHLVATTVADQADMELVGLFTPEAAGEVIKGVPVSADPSALKECDVIVDFTRPDVVMENLIRWRDFGAHAVVGTSGFGEERLEGVRRMWSGEGNCLIVPNFSIGAALMMRFAELAAPFFQAAEIVELHHDRKADAPSGTALSTAERLGSASEQRRSVISEESVPGARGATVCGVSVHSIRLPGLLAHQEVILGSPGEILTLRHDSTDRVSFMPGVLAAIRSVGGLPGVTVGLDKVLDL